MNVHTDISKYLSNGNILVSGISGALTEHWGWAGTESGIVFHRPFKFVRHVTKLMSSGI